MGRNLLRKSNKRGVSIMVGYVILIVIAISLSIAVFAFLKLYLPKENAKCSEDIILTIDSASCIDEDGDGKYNIEIELKNRGFFSVDGAFIRIGEVGRIYKVLLYQNPSALFSLEESATLKPDGTWKNDLIPLTYEPKDISKPQEIEIEPIVFVDSKQILCENSVVKKVIECEQQNN